MTISEHFARRLMEAGVLNTHLQRSVDPDSEDDEVTFAGVNGEISVQIGSDTDGFYFTFEDSNAAILGTKATIEDAVRFARSLAIIHLN